MNRQKDRIRELLDRPSFRLIVLDACRYDYFERECPYKGELECVRSAGSCTKEWAPRTFPDYYVDTVYISSIPYVSHLDIEGWKATDHFKEVIPVWMFGWCDVDGIETVHPVAVVETALLRERDKVIIHVLQPHFPYIGETRLNVANLLGKARDDVIGGGSGYVHYEKRGVYPASPRLAQAYRDNLRLAFKAIEPLILPGTVITADHGELLGDDGLMGHPPFSNHPILVNVPWFVMGDDGRRDR